MTYFSGHVHLNLTTQCTGLPRCKNLRTFSLDVNFCKNHRNKIEVPDPLAVKDLISNKLKNKRKLARLITQYRDFFFSNISGGTAFLLQGVTENDKSFNVTSLKYGKYDVTNEKINNDKRMIDRAR